MIDRLTRFAPLAVLLGVVVCYGGFVAPSLWEALIAGSGFLWVWDRRRQGLPFWPAGRNKFLLALLMGGSLLQLAISPNRWATFESVVWVLAALVIASIFSQDPADRARDRWVALTAVAAAAIQAVLLPITVMSGEPRAGTFVSPNHTAALLILGFWVAWRTGKVLLFGFSTWGGQARTLLLAAILGGMLLTFSAGGFLALGLSVALFFLKDFIPGRKSVPLVFGLLLAAQVTYAYFGQQPAQDRELSSILPLKVRDPDRLAMIRAAVNLVSTRPIVGSALSAYPELFPAISDIETTDRLANFAHNDFLQLAAELGLPLLLAALYLCWKLFRALAQPCQLEDIGRHRLRQATFWGGSALLFHSLVDFPWHAPGIFLIFVMLAAASLPTEEEPSRKGWLLVATASAIIGIFSLLSGYTRWTTREVNHLDRSARWALGNPAPALSFGRLLLRMGKFEDAVFQLDRAARRAPYNADALEYYGIALAGAGNISRAAGEMKRAADIDPRNAKRLIRVGHWLVNRGYLSEGLATSFRLKELSSHWRTACFDIVSRIGFDPHLMSSCIHVDQPEEVLRLGEYLRANHQLEAAYTVALQALPDGLTEGYFLWYFDLAKAVRQENPTLAKLEESKPHTANRSLILRLKGKLLLAQKKPEEALAVLDEAAQADGHPAFVWNEMQETLYMVPNTETCLKLGEAWQAKWPDSPYPFLADSVCAIREERYARALVNVQKALRNDPGSVETRWMEIDLLKRRQMIDRAVDAACRGHVPKSGENLLRYCLTGLGSAKRCPELRKVWDDHESFGLNGTPWVQFQESLKGDAGVQECLAGK